jgi:hypothetical protein
MFLTSMINIYPVIIMMIPRKTYANKVTYLGLYLSESHDRVRKVIPLTLIYHEFITATSSFEKKSLSIRFPEI